MNTIDINSPSLASVNTERDTWETTHSAVSEETNEANGYATNRSDDNTSIQVADTTRRPFQYPESFLLRIPKADLHTHLDGSIRIPTLIDLARQQNVPLPSYDLTELKRTVFPETYASLEEYLCGFGYITTVLRTPESL